MTMELIKMNLNEYGIHHIEDLIEETGRLCYEHYYVLNDVTVDMKFQAGILDLFFLTGRYIINWYRTGNDLIKVTVLMEL